MPWLVSVEICGFVYSRQEGQSPHTRLPVTSLGPCASWAQTIRLGALPEGRRVEREGEFANEVTAGCA
jgi:hypothetical protein